MSEDPVRQTYWVFTDQSLFEIVIGNEARDVWKIYLEQGQFDIALGFSKVVLQLSVILHPCVCAHYIAHRRRINVIEFWLLKLIRILRKQDTFKLLDATRNAQRHLRRSCSSFWILENVML